MTEAMPFLQKVILLSYDPRPFGMDAFPLAGACQAGGLSLPSARR